MNKKILIATEKPFAPAAVKQMKKIAVAKSYEIVLLEKYQDKQELIDAVADVDAMVIRSDKATKEVLEAGKNLKIVVRAGAGYDNIDLEAATEKGIVAMNTPGQNSNAVAELALGMMIYMARGQYNGKAGTELKGKRLGIHAYGNVGKIVATIAKGFGMEVLAFDPFVDKTQIETDGVKVVDSVEELYSNSEYISLHIPANDKTKKSINATLMNLMPKNGTIINTARKEVVCEESLKDVLSQRDDFKYASDIAPDCAAKLTSFENRFYATPKKMGAQTAEANINAGVASINQIISFLENGDITFKVN
jgi:D-3-phosphoglycerate dehydrogenase / 2-oxoglutarate reductase